MNNGTSIAEVNTEGYKAEETSSEKVELSSEQEKALLAIHEAQAREMQDPKPEIRSRLAEMVHFAQLDLSADSLKELEDEAKGY
jgi:hypothetical protein